MSDLKLKKTENYDFDLVFDGEDLVLTEGLETSVIISLLTWARRSPDDPDPVPGGDQMGWWGDETLEPTGDFVGGKLWLTARSKVTQETILRIKEWGSDALDWMLEDGVADDVAVTAERNSTHRDRIDILVAVTKPTGETENFKFELNWEAQVSGGQN